MGSGVSGRYYGTHGSSQRYAVSYGVCKDMQERDICRGIYSKKYGYAKNPTAKKLAELIRGNYIVSKRECIRLPYAITTKGDIIVGRRNGNGKDGDPTPHPTLIGGKHPKVRCAGILEIAGGKIKSIDANSGHFKPNTKSLPDAKKILEKLPRKLFHKKYEWSK